MNHQTIEYIDNEIELDDNYIFSLPKDIHREYINDYCVVINPQSGIFMVLFNEVQISYFDFIDGKSVQQLKKIFGEDDDDLNYVLMAFFDSGLSTCAEQFTTNGKNSSLFIYLTDKCNFSCKHCYRNNDTLHSKTLNIDHWLNIVKKFKSHGGKEITISGGEPLLYKDIIKLITYIKEQDLKLTILSNGTLWKNLFRNKTNLISEIDEIQISLDGFDEHSFSLMRGPGNFRTVLDNILWLKNNNGNISLAVTANPEVIINNDNYLKLRDFLCSLKADFIIRLTQKILPNNGTKSFNEDLYYKRMQELSEYLYPNNNISKWISVYWSELPRENNCGWGNITINSIGDVYTCNRTDQALNLGNVLTHDLQEIISLADIEKEKTSVDNVYPCKFCELRMVCNGGCRIDDFKLKDEKLFRICSESSRTKKYTNIINAVSEIYYGDDCDAN
ncbi:radical SAM protein [Kluyvera georgiana]|uniref:radical SAM protein n=1 Tax=Kluyvera georgiana TaxID=73098 RepID=UPI003F6680E9